MASAAAGPACEHPQRETVGLGLADSAYFTGTIYSIFPGGRIQRVVFQLVQLARAHVCALFYEQPRCDAYRDGSYSRATRRHDRARGSGRDAFPGWDRGGVAVSDERDRGWGYWRGGAETCAFSGRVFGWVGLGGRVRCADRRVGQWRHDADVAHGPLFVVDVASTWVG